MKKYKHSPFSVICITLGGLLILSAVIILVSSNVSTEINRINCENALIKTEKLLPDVYDAFPDERYADTMPSMEIEGMDVGGIIEVPGYKYRSVISAIWDTSLVNSIPCRLKGCVYNNSMIVGTTDSQFGFAKSMDAGDKIYITDMSGGRYAFSLEKVEHSANADMKKLESGDWDLTVYVKVSEKEYLLLRCCVVL